MEQRHRTSDHVLEMVSEISASQVVLQNNQVLLDEKLTSHILMEKLEIEEAVAKLLVESFPMGDPAGHKRYHEAVIKAAEKRAEFWGKLSLALAQYGLFGFLGWAGYSLWNTFLQGPHK